MVPVVKANGKLRLSVVLTKLNESVCRERHILPSVEQSLWIWGSMQQAAFEKIKSDLASTLGINPGVKQKCPQMHPHLN